MSTSTTPFSVRAVQPWSWKVYGLILCLAPAAALLLVEYPLVWIIAIAVLAIWVQFRSPITSLGVVIIACGLLTYSPFETGAISRLYPGDLAIGMFLLAWFLRVRGPLRSAFEPGLMSKPLFAIGIVMLLSMLWSRLHPDSSVTYSFPHSDVSWTTTQISQVGLIVAVIGTPFAVAGTIKHWRDVEKIVTMVGTVVAVGTVLTLAALIYGFGGTLTILGVTRAYWDQPWVSSMSPLSALILPFLYAGVLFGRGAISRYWMICWLLVFCVLGVSLTFSRETWLLGFLAVLVLSILWLRRKRASLLPTMVLGMLLFGLFMSGIGGLVSRFYNPDEVYGLERIYYYITGARLFITHPILGVGAGNYQFFDITYAEESPGGISHNHFITIAAETGLLGLMMFIWLLLALVKIVKRFKVLGPSPTDTHYWVKVGGCMFVLEWITECFFREAFFVSAAAGGGTKLITATIFPWVLLGVLFAVLKLDQSRPAAEAIEAQVVA